MNIFAHQSKQSALIWLYCVSNWKQMLEAALRNLPVGRFPLYSFTVRLVNSIKLANLSGDSDGERWRVEAFDISVRLSREVMSYLTFSTRAERRALGVWLTAQTVRVFSDTAWGRFPLMCVCVCVCVCARDWTHSSNALRFYSGLPCGAERGGEDTGRKEKWKRGWAGGQ